LVPESDSFPPSVDDETTVAPDVVAYFVKRQFSYASQSSKADGYREQTAG
jgi:hypothetical protein